MQLIDNLEIVNTYFTNDGVNDVPQLVETVNSLIDAGKTVDFQVTGDTYGNVQIYVIAGQGKKRAKRLGQAKLTRNGVGATYFYGAEKFDEYLLLMSEQFQADNLEVEIYPQMFGSPSALVLGWETDPEVTPVAE